MLPLYCLSMAQKKEKPADPLAILRKRVGTAPNEPGVYRWLNKDGTVIYVGKAKNLKNRLKSYLPAGQAGVQNNKGGHGPWRQSFLAQIADFDVTIAQSELEALLLEANLIKELKPKYNVLLKDDKNYQFVRVSLQEPYPRVMIVRRLADDGAKYFGPYLSSYELHQLLDLAHEALAWRACKESLEVLNRDPERASGKLRTCLEFQIGKCNGLCSEAITREDYKSRIDALVDFLKGKRENIRSILTEKMKTSAADKKFERAATLRNYLQLLEDKPEAQVVTDTTGEDSDVLGVAILSERAHVVILHRRGGRMIGEAHFALAGQAESAASVLEQFLPQFYGEGREIPPMILLPEALEDNDAMTDFLRERRGKAVSILMPERGHKSHLLMLAERNAREKARQQEMKWESEERNRTDALTALQQLLSLPGLPERIEGYDISHLGGTETVGSMVVIKGGKAANDQYRSFGIRTMQSGEIDDYKSLREVLSRRLRRLTEDLKTEEAVLAKDGIVLRKARKGDQAALTKIRDDMGLHTDKDDYKESTVALEGEKIIGFARLNLSVKAMPELQSVWVDDKKRGKRIGQLIVRKILKSVKKGKVYLIAEDALEQYYTGLGFRYVIKPPPAMEKKMNDLRRDRPEIFPVTVMMWEAHQNKTDPSLCAKPDLLVIDGGKGQLSTVVEVLKESGLTIPVIGLAKREEEIFVPGSSIPILFPKDSPAKFLLMRLRDEAHRFANKHREGRGLKTMKQSALDEIPGVGDATRTELMKKFGSVETLGQATDEELLTVLNAGQVAMIKKFFGR